MPDTAPAPKKSRLPRIFYWGLVLLFGGFGLNTTLLVLGVHGYLRELTRLTTIVGIFLFLIGIVQILVIRIGKLLKREKSE